MGIDLRNILADELLKLGLDDRCLATGHGSDIDADFATAALSAMRRVLMECATIAARQVDKSTCMSCRDANKIWENISTLGDAP